MKKAWAEGRREEREKRCDVQRQNDGGPEKNYVMQAGLRSVVEVAGSACSCMQCAFAAQRSGGC